jgi:hypothetical protein
VNFSKAPFQAGDHVIVQAAYTARTISTLSCKAAGCRSRMSPWAPWS